MSEPKLLVDLMGRDGGRSEVEVPANPNNLMGLGPDGLPEMFHNYGTIADGALSLNLALAPLQQAYFSASAEITPVNAASGAKRSLLIANTSGAAITITIPAAVIAIGNPVTGVASLQSGLLEFFCFSVLAYGVWTPKVYYRWTPCY